ncbi:MAG: hemolysin family protein [Actinomycetota bacterium]|nr:hemolysin family protein [Actinomycetota bacterium]
MSEPLLAVFIVLLIALAALATSARAALESIDKVRAHHLVDQGRSGSERLLKIVERPVGFSHSLMFVAVAGQVGATVVAVALAEEVLDDVAGLVAAVVMIGVIFLTSQVAPLAVARGRPDAVALRTCGFTYAVGRALAPIGRVGLVALRSVSRRRSAADGDEESLGVNEQPPEPDEHEEIEEDERDLIHSVFEFGDTLVREVMVPRTDMVAVKSDCTLGEALHTITEAGYSRIPIYEGDTDNIVGVLYAKDLLKRAHELTEKEEKTVFDLARSPLFVPEQKRVSDLLRDMQNERVHMAIVVDEYGGTAGLVTIEDLIEEIVGEIVDEYDQEEPLVEPLEGDTIRVSARLPIDEVNELLEVDLPHEEWDTVGGLVFGLTGRVPAPGEKVTFDSLEFTTEKVSGRRIQKVVITKVPEKPAQAAR